MLNINLSENKKLFFPKIISLFTLISISLVRAAKIFVLFYVFKNLVDQGISISFWTSDLVLVILIYVGFAVLDPLLVTIFNYFLRIIINNVNYDVRNQIYKKYYQTNINFLKQKNSGEILNTINVDFQYFLFAWFNYVFGIIPKLIGAIAAIVFVGIINWIVLLIFLSFSTILLIAQYVGAKLENKTKIKKSEASEQFGVETLQKFSIFQLYLNSNYKLPFLNYLKIITNRKNKIYRSQDDNVVWINTPLLIFKTCTVLFLFLFTLLLFKDNLIVGIPIITLALTQFGSFNDFISEAVSIFGDIDDYKNFSKKINNYLKEYENQKVNLLTDDIESIELKNVSFNADDKNIIQDLNLKMNFNDKVLISGPSGCGKSTILSIILNEQKINSGTLLFNGQELPANTEVYSKVAYASDDNYILDGNLDENITFNIDNINNQILSSLKQNLKIDYVKDQKANLNMLNLSEGQKQKIVIARAFYQNRKILIFDEVISNLDDQSKNLVEKYLLNYSGILLFISHVPLKSEKQIFNKVLDFDTKDQKWKLKIYN